jgi:hypothetical protein
MEKKDLEKIKIWCNEIFKNNIFNSFQYILMESDLTLSFVAEYNGELAGFYFLNYGNILNFLDKKNK